MGSVCVARAMEVLGVTSVFPDTITTRIVSHATVLEQEVYLPFVILLESVPVYRTFPEDSVLCVFQGIINIRNVCHVIAISMDLLVYLVTMKDNVNVRITSTERLVTSVKRVSTTSPLVKNATAIQLGLLLSLLDADRFQPENFVNARREFMAEFAINVDRCIGI